MRAARLGLLVLIAVAATVHGAAAQTAFERFQLFNDCRPMYLLVEGLNADAAAISLTEERLRTAAESRLRVARLYESALAMGGAVLYVNVGVNGRAFVVFLAYKKTLLDPASGEGGLGTTWENGSTGTHGGDAERVVSTLSRHLDQFLTEYLRVNEAACGD